MFKRIENYDDFTVDNFVTDYIKNEATRKLLFEQILLEDFGDINTKDSKKQMFGSFKKINLEKILCFYTFNYDLVLENHLTQMYKEIKPRNNNIKKLRDNFTFHLHGLIDDGGEYIYNNSFSCIDKTNLNNRQSINYRGIDNINLKILFENNIISKIIFIGFGFDKRNLKHINCDSPVLYLNKRIKKIIIDFKYENIDKILDFFKSLISTNFIQNHGPLNYNQYDNSLRHIIKFIREEIIKNNNPINLNIVNTIIRHLSKNYNILFIPKKIEDLSADDWVLINE